MLMIAFLAGACSPQTPPSTPTPPPPPAAPAETVTPPPAGDAQVPSSPDAAVPGGPPPAGNQQSLPNGVKYTILKPGQGKVAEPGKTVSVHYTGWLTDGKQFDSSRGRGEPFEFALGAGQVIPGWDTGVAGMKVGEQRRLEIPPEHGYGAQGAGSDIPPNSTLIFEVELLDVP